MSRTITDADRAITEHAAEVDRRTELNVRKVACGRCGANVGRPCSYDNEAGKGPVPRAHTGRYLAAAAAAYVPAMRRMP